MKHILTLFVSIFLTSCVCEVPISAFEGHPFSLKPPSAMYQLADLNLENLDFGTQIVAYGDFNNDKYTDIVTLANDQKTLSVFLYSHATFNFATSCEIHLDDPIDSAIPGDYNYDGLLDLLIISSAQGSKQTNLEYYFRQTEFPYFKNETDVSTLLKTTAQPFILDVLGDRHVDLMFVEDGVRKIQQWNNDGTYNISNFSDFISTDKACITNETLLNNEFSSPHSNSFVDFNGDCAADLFITSLDPTDKKTVFEIWLRHPIDKQFCLVSYNKLQYSEISMVSTADMNNDGRVDIVYAEIPSDDSKPMNLQVIYNQFPVNYKKPCEVQLLALISPFGENAFTSNESIVKVKQISPIVTKSTSTLRIFKSSSSQPPRIRIGDVNIDGYPDVVFVGVSSTQSDSGNIILGINENGVVKFDISSMDSHNQAYFSVFLTADHFGSESVPLSTYQVVSASFFDFDEYGKPGIWAVTLGEDSQSLIGLFNFVSSENFIVKTLGLNGFTKGGEITESLGGIYHGTSIECVITNLDGDSRIAKGVQLPQSAYNPLDLPYMFIGLGRTNNYIENFVMGIPKAFGDGVQTTKWTPLIPNSQLIVNPNINKHWTLDVFVNPTSGTLYVVLATVAILLILGAIILYLHRKEKKEDEKDRDILMRVFA